MIVLHYAAMMNSYLDFCMQCSAHTAMQFIAIEITIMHKIQIEWNSIRHFPMGLCREGGRSPVPLWVFHWVWMQCTSSLVISEIRIKKCTISPPPFLSVNPHVRSRKPGDSDYYERCLICGEFEARKEASDFTECWCWREREMEEGGEREEMRRGVNRKLETSVPAWALRVEAQAQSYQLTIYSQLCSRSQNISLFPEV